MEVISSPLGLNFLSDTLDPRCCFLKCIWCMRLCLLWPWDIASDGLWEKSRRWEEGIFEQGQEAMFCWYNALWRGLVIFAMLVSLAAFQGKLQESVWGKWERSIFYTRQWLTVCWKSRYCSESGLCLLRWLLHFRIIMMRLAVHRSSCFLYACPKVILALSFVWLSSPRYLCSRPPPPPNPTAFSLPLPFQFLQDPAFLPPPSPQTQCAAPQPFGRGALLSPSETQRCGCLLLMSASPHHLGKEGKIHKRDGKYISFSFIRLYFKKVEGKVLVLFSFSDCTLKPSN